MSWLLCLPGVRTTRGETATDNGAGGIGKTRLALQLTTKLKELQWRCEWWATVKKRTSCCNPGR